MDAPTYKYEGREAAADKDGYNVGAAYVSQEKSAAKVTDQQRGRFKIAFWKCFHFLAVSAPFKDGKSLPLHAMRSALINHFGEEVGSDIACGIERAFAERDELKEKVKKLEEQLEDWKQSAMDRSFASTR